MISLGDQGSTHKIYGTLTDCPELRSVSRVAVLQNKNLGEKEIQNVSQKMKQIRSTKTDEIKKELEKRNIDPNIIEILNQLFNNCEMARYTPITNVEMESDYKTALDIISKIDKSTN